MSPDFFQTGYFQHRSKVIAGGNTTVPATAADSVLKKLLRFIHLKLETGYALPQRKNPTFNVSDPRTVFF